MASLVVRDLVVLVIGADPIKEVRRGIVFCGKRPRGMGFNSPPPTGTFTLCVALLVKIHCLLLLLLCCCLLVLWLLLFWPSEMVWCCLFVLRFAF